MERRLRLIVGLGNPKPSYAKNRHNVGRQFVKYLLNEKDRSGPKAITLPSYMNQSGPALKRAVQSSNVSDDVPPSEVLVVFDDFMIPFGTVRLRPSGSAGGHNGLQSIIDTFGTEEVGRLRVGIGPVEEETDPADFVLENFAASERKKLPDIFKTMREGLDVLQKDGYQKGMGFLNRSHV